jgi:hypothetical protein
MKGKYLFLLILPLLVFSILLTSPLGISQISANGQETCPDTGDWTKIEPLDGLSYTLNAPSGYMIAETCYKASTTVVYQDVLPPVSSVEIHSSVWNKPECTEVGEGCSLQDLSHASMRLVKIQNPFVRITYICELPEDGTVEGYGVTGFAGEHLWRVRHEKGGPSTDFTLMAGGNIFAGISDHINTDETLLYLTKDKFNGVSVKTSPLPNDYEGTASVSGALCSMMEEYVQCSETTMVEGTWSDWQVDPSDPTREYSERTISYYDSMDPEYLCESKVETKYQDIPEDPETPEEDTPDVLGESDEIEGVGVVLAETGATSNILVYVTQAILTLSTIFSGIFFSKKYIM